MPVATSVLEAALEAAFGPRIRAVERRPFTYTTSHMLEQVDVVLDEGAVVELVLKDGQALANGVQAAKPAFLRDPEREVTVYRHLPVRAYAGAPSLYASGRTWVLLERVQAPPLTEVGEFATWERAARRLALLHERLRSWRCPHLLQHDRDFLKRWFDRAQAFTADLGPLSTAHAYAVERLVGSSRLVIHGELYASNVLAAQRRISIVDWETAAVGPALTDIAALTSGSWNDDARIALALAYRSALAAPPPVKAFLHDLECARLHLAIQWLGWSETWTPPKRQRQDWLAEAERAAEWIH
jgi:Phosphotransferase enzyme family